MLDLQAIERLLEPVNGTTAFSVCISRSQLAGLVAEVKRLSGETRPLSPSQNRVLEFVVDFIDGHGYAPSFDEIAADLGYSTLSTVHEHLKNIERKGWITREYNENRGITVLHRPVRREAQV